MQLESVTSIVESYDDWAYVLERQISRTATVEVDLVERKFLLGDLYLWGRRKYGEDKALQAVPESTYARKTLMNVSRVCELVPPENRIPSLTFSHHDAVARCDALLQKQVLEQAARDELSVSQTRALLPAPERSGPLYEILGDKVLEDGEPIATFIPGRKPVEWYQKKLVGALGGGKAPFREASEPPASPPPAHQEEPETRSSSSSPPCPHEGITIDARDA